MVITGLTAVLLVTATAPTPDGASQEMHEHDTHDHEGQAHGAHVHGVAHLAIAIAGDGTVEAELSSAGHNVFGFERAPQTAAEREQVDAARAALLDASQVVRFARQAGCTVLGSEIVTEGEGDAAYRDVRVRYRFSCSEADRLGRVETGLFEAFPRLEEIEGVLLTPTGQTGFDLTPGAPSHRLAP